MNCRCFWTIRGPEILGTTSGQSRSGNLVGFSRKRHQTKYLVFFQTCFASRGNSATEWLVGVAYVKTATNFDPLNCTEVIPKTGVKPGVASVDFFVRSNLDAPPSL